MSGSDGRRAKRETGTRWSVTLATLILTVALLSMALTLELRAGSVPLTVAVLSVTATNDTLEVQLRLTPEHGALGAHVALLPGEDDGSVSHVFVFYDPGYFLRFGTANDVVGLAERIADYLAHVSSPLSVTLVNAASLPSVLQGNPEAALLDFAYDTIPDTVYSANSSELRTWVNDGGTLIWAGGPLAYFEGHELPGGGFSYDNLGWEGQVDFTGYPLEDPIGNPASRSYGPLLGSSQSPLGASLGISYAGTPDGANLTELQSHNGTDLGYDAVPVGSAAGRTSLAYLPVGKGRLFYFGGAIWGDAIGVVPGADSSLSADIELLLGTGYVPLPGPTTYEELTLPYLSSTTVSLGVTGEYTHAVVVVTCSFGPTSLFLWSRQVI